MPFDIRIDTREQHPWMFRDLRTRTYIFEVKASKGTLSQGDYAIEGMEQELVVERKSLEDLFSTLASGRERFERELQRITDCCRQGAVIIEAPWEVIYEPEKHRTNWQSGMRPQSVIGFIQAFIIRYPKVHWLPMPTRTAAEWTCFQLLRFTHKRHMERWTSSFERTDGE
jgi:ERCC4-type nuclease